MCDATDDEVLYEEVIYLERGTDFQSEMFCELQYILTSTNGMKMDRETLSDIQNSIMEFKNKYAANEESRYLWVKIVAKVEIKIDKVEKWLNLKPKYLIC